MQKAGHLKLDVALQFISVLILLSTWPPVVPWVFDICVEECIAVDAVLLSCLTLATPRTVAWQAPLPGDFPGKNAGAVCHFLFQGIFLIQGSDLCLSHCERILYHWPTSEAHEESIKIPKHVTQSFKTMVSVLICSSEKAESRGQVKITQSSLVLHIYIYEQQKSYRTRWQGLISPCLTLNYRIK